MGYSNPTILVHIPRENNLGIIMLIPRTKLPQEARECHNQILFMIFLNIEFEESIRWAVPFDLNGVKN